MIMEKARRRERTPTARPFLSRAAVPALALMTCLVLAGCDTVCDTCQSIAGGTVANADIRIVAADGSFTLNGGQTFQSPFQAKMIIPDADFGAPADYVVGKGFGGGDDVVDAYTQALQDGAKPVRIYTSGNPTPLYGLLLLWPAARADCHGPGTNSYLISIPPDKIAAARHGNISVAYETVTCSYGDSNWSEYTWLLWMSNAPLASNQAAIPGKQER